MKLNALLYSVFPLTGTLIIVACGTSGDDDDINKTGDNDISVLASKFYNDPTVTFDIGDNIITIKSSNNN